MSWKVVFLPEAEVDLKVLDGAVRPQIIRGILKVCENPGAPLQGSTKSSSAKWASVWYMR